VTCEGYCSKPNTIYGTLKGYVDKTLSFQSYALLDETLNAAQITAREVIVGVRAGATEAQWTAVENAVNYGASKGVTVKIYVVRD